MSKVFWLLRGGFLKGYRTQVLGWVTLASTMASWAIGDMSLADLVDKLPLLLGGAGLVTVGDKVDAVKNAFVEAVKTKAGSVDA